MDDLCFFIGRRPPVVAGGDSHWLLNARRTFRRVPLKHKLCHPGRGSCHPRLRLGARPPADKKIINNEEHKSKYCLLKRVMLFSLLLLFITFPTTAQTTFQIGAHYGRMLEINPVWPDIQHNSRALELSILKPTSGEKEWHGLYRYPEIGLSFLYIQPGNPDVFGQVITFSPVINFRLIEKGNFQLKTTVGYSLGWATRPFHRINNPDNNVVGAFLNSVNLFRLESVWYPSEKFSYHLGISAFHLSNSRTRVPNLGINIPALNLAIGYQKDNPSTEKKKPIELPKGFGDLQIGMRIGYGRNSSKTPGGPVYPSYLGAVYLNSIVQNRFRLKLGTEWFWTESQYAFIRNQVIPSEDPRRDALGGVVFLGTEFLMGNIALIAHLGPYIKRPYLMDYLLYTKIGVQVYLYDQQENPRFQPYLGAFVHAHSGEADLAEFGVGFVF